MTAAPSPPRLSDKEIAAYFTELGRFIHAFAYAEGALQHALRKEVGLSHEIGAALFPSLRVDAGKSAINRVLEATGADLSPALASAFAQFTVVAKARNDIVHHGARFGPDRISVSNINAIFSADKLRVRPLSATILKDLSEDVGRINAMIWLHTQARHGAPRERGRAKDDLDYLATLPWQYKPPQPPLPQRPPRDTPPKPRPQRDA